MSYFRARTSTPTPISRSTDDIITTKEGLSGLYRIVSAPDSGPGPEVRGGRNQVSPLPLPPRSQPITRASPRPGSTKDDPMEIGKARYVPHEKAELIEDVSSSSLTIGLTITSVLALVGCCICGLCCCRR